MKVNDRIRKAAFHAVCDRLTEEQKDGHTPKQWGEKIDRVAREIAK